MTMTAVSPPAAPTRSAVLRPIHAVLAGWIAFCLLNAANAAFFSPRWYLDFDSDSLMRLQQVRDLLAGQGWFDLHQARLGDPGGASMHWTRVADLGIAGLVLVFRPVLGQAHAEIWAAALYPLLLFLPFLALIARTARNLDGATAGVPAITVATALLSPAALIHFQPGNIDHHNLQLIALAMVVCGATGGRTGRDGLLAGAGVALGIAVGVDAAPVVMAVAAALLLLWARQPGRYARFLRAFGLSIVGLVAAAVLVFSPHPWSTQSCDSLTPPMAAFFLAFGGVWLAATAFFGRLASPAARFAAAAGFGLGAGALLLLVFPACRNPIPLNHPLLWTYWMNAINENRSVVDFALENPFRLISLYVPTFIALIWTVRLVRAGALPGGACATLAAAIVMATALTMNQVRALPQMATLIVPLIAVAIARLQTSPSMLRRLGAWVLFVPTGYTLIGYKLDAALPEAAARPAAQQEVTPGASVFSQYCLDDRLLQRLRALPASSIATGMNLSPLLIAYTPHRLLAATYHRNAAVNLWTIQWLTAPPATAAALLAQRRPDYMLYCPQDPMFMTMAQGAPAGLLAQIAQGRPPNWLRPALPLNDGGMLYAVRPNTLRTPSITN